jgi:uncharacterized repeat protein (TIGR03803 family)
MSHPGHRNVWILRLTVLAAAGLLVGVPFASAQAQDYSIVYTFGIGGVGPNSALSKDAAGNLYGTTATGAGDEQDGLIYKLTPGGGETVVYTFNGVDGQNPFGNLIRDKEGTVYGVTLYGGADDDGTVFKLDTKKHHTVLYSFTGRNGDGEYPEGGLVRDEAANFYGTTIYGGQVGCGNGLGCGMVFKLSASGKETALHRFTGGKDGGWPAGSLVRDDQGNLYGVASGGGDLKCDSGYGCGTIFKITAKGKFSVLHTFTGSDGATPQATMIRDASGNLYGTTVFGGTANFGTIFKLDPSGSLTVLHQFLGSPKDGAYPYFAPLARDTAGNLYGVTLEGGDYGSKCEIAGGSCGVAFKLDRTGKINILHFFTGLNGDGAAPGGGLVLDEAGELYGITYRGGNLSECPPPTYGCGAAFRVKP